MKKKVLHVITGLNQGGAERQLANLVTRMPDESVVFSLLKPGVMADELKEAGVHLYHGGVTRSFSPAWLAALRIAIKTERPDIVVGWMYHGNVAASLSALLGHKGPILWNVRHSVHDIAREKTTTRLAIKAGKLLAKTPARVIYNSEVAATQHELLGYPRSKRVVLPNGFDLARFRVDDETRCHWRSKLGLSSDALLLGVVGRSHPMKNHIGWLEAFYEVVREKPSAHCVMIGSGVAENNGSVASAVRELGLSSNVTLLRPTATPETLYPAFDLLVMPSLWGEGFPNVVGEAMACGVPALVTNVGDAALVVGNTGFVVDGDSPGALAKRTVLALDLGQSGLKELGGRAHERMHECFSLNSVVQRYRDIFESTIKC
ncbi:glycosyltransferase [Marinobacter piscensis]|uniref:glycosyltransferase n=1 Tax=Marinobacter piscensis TaxID=1562308 RepID=UPI0011A05B0C|nr:glycosyltransferase [Marinobacter piscensis]